MTGFKPKPIDEPGLINILMLTRGRPEKVVRAIASLDDRAFNKDQISLWIYVDDDGDGFLGAHLHDKFAYFQLLFRGEAKLIVGLWPHGAVGVIPCVHYPQFDELIEPAFLQEVIDVCLTQAGGHAGQQLVVYTVQDALHTFAIDVVLTTTLVADDFGSLDGNERGYIAHRAHFFRDLIGDELPIGKNLKIAVRMFCQNIEQALVHEGFPAKDAEKAVACFAGLADEPV